MISWHDVWAYAKDWTCQYKQTFLLDGPLVTSGYISVAILVDPELMALVGQGTAILAGLSSSALALARLYVVLKNRNTNNNG